MMAVSSYAFEDDAITAFGVPVRITAGEHRVERRSLVHRARVGRRQADLTLAEFNWQLSIGWGAAHSDPAATGRAQLDQATCRFPN